MRKWCGWLLVGLVVYLAFAGSSRAQEAGSDAPYLYYYSDVLNAFVIERADGTDSRVFGDGLMPDGTASADGPGWSPSGKWFAWTSHYRNTGFYEYNDLPWVINRAGTTRLTVLDDMNYVYMDWSPTDDLLFVSGLVGAATDDDTINYVNIRLALVDPQANTIITSVEKRLVYDNYAFFEDPMGEGYATFYDTQSHPEFIWTPDGQHVIAHFGEKISADPETWQHVFEVFDLDGNITERVVPEPLVPTVLWKSFLSPTGTIVYQANEAKSISFENVVSGERQSVALLGLEQESFDWIDSLKWNATGNYAFLTLTNYSCYPDICGYVNGLLSISDATFQTSFIEQSSLHEVRPYNEYWSLEGSYAILKAVDNTGYEGIYTFNLATLTVTSLPFLTVEDDAESQKDWSWYWSSDSEVVFADVAFNNTLTHTLYRYNAETGNTTVLEWPSAPFVSPFPWITADERYLVGIGEGVFVYDTFSQTSTLFQPDSRSFWTNAGGEISCHSIQDWCLVYKEAGIAGGGFERWTGTINLDNYSRHEISYCQHPRFGCGYWLPEQVNVDELPSARIVPPQPQPELVLRGSAWACLLSWSPDGKELLSGRTDCGRNNNLETTIWDLGSQATIGNMTAIEDEETVEWRVNADGTYTPIIVAMPAITKWNDDYVMSTSPDGTFIIVNVDYSFKVFDPITSELLQDIGRFHTSFYSISYSSDGRIMAASDPLFGPGKLWDTETWEVLATLPTPSPAVAFSPDGTKLAVASSWDIQIWDVAEVLEWGRESGQVD